MNGYKSKSNLTLEKVAKLAGVSRSTVSRVINNQPGVKPEVQQRVSKIVAETGYYPNPAARSLVNHQTGIIGLVVPLQVQSLFVDPYFPRLIQGITQACNNHDYTLSLFLFHSDEEESKLYPKILRNQLFDGIIITATQVNDLLVPQLLANKVPFISVGRHENSQVSFIDVDNVAGAYTAVIHLIRLGYQRIATIAGPAKNLSAVDRLQGYLNALRDRGYPIDNELIVNGDFTEVSGYEAMQRLLPHKPEAVFVASDAMAVGALRALQNGNIAVPNQIALIGFDDFPPATIAIPPLTTIRQPIKQVGIMAVEVLLDILNDETKQPQRIILPTELVIRDSCGSTIERRRY